MCMFSDQDKFKKNCKIIGLLYVPAARQSTSFPTLILPIEIHLSRIFWRKINQFKRSTKKLFPNAEKISDVVNTYICYFVMEIQKTRQAEFINILFKKVKNYLLCHNIVRMKAK